MSAASGGGISGGAGGGLPGGPGLEGGPKVVPVLSNAEAEAARVAKLAEAQARTAQAREGQEASEILRNPPIAPEDLESATPADGSQMATVAERLGVPPDEIPVVDAVPPEAAVSKDESHPEPVVAPVNGAGGEETASGITADDMGSTADTTVNNGDQSATGVQADHPAGERGAATAPRTNEAPVAPDTATDGGAHEPVSPRTAVPDAQNGGALPPAQPETQKPVDSVAAAKAKERSDDMQSQIKADADLQAILRHADIQYDPKAGLNVDAQVIALEAKVNRDGESMRTPAEERALRRLKEVQGIANLHEGQKEMQILTDGERAAVGTKTGKERDDILREYRERTKKEYDSAREKIDKGRVSERQHELRGKMLGDARVRELFRELYGDNFSIEDADVDKAITKLESMDKFTDAKQKDHVQELHDRLKAMRNGVEKEQFAQDIPTVRTQAALDSVISKIAEASQDQNPGIIKRARDRLGRGIAGISHEQLKYLHRQAAGYKNGLKFLEEQRDKLIKEGKLEEAAGKDASIANMRQLAREARNEWAKKWGIRTLLIIFILNSALFILGPSVLAAKGLQMMGKAPQ